MPKQRNHIVKNIREILNLFSNFISLLYVTIPPMKLRFVEKQHEGDDVWSFFFEPIEPLRWTAGQSIRLELPRLSYGIDERRFSIASAPHEKHLRIATRQGQSSFKQNLFRLTDNALIDGYAVEGSFVWGKQRTHRLLMAGGIGITPFRAMLLEQAHRSKPIDASLIHTVSRTPPLFYTEFEELSRHDSSFKYFPLQDRLVLGEQTTLPDIWLRSTVYVSGPSLMVDELGDALLQKGLPENKLKRDWFTGYHG